MRRQPRPSRFRVHPLHILLFSALLVIPAPAMLSAQQAEEGFRFWGGPGLGGVRDQHGQNLAMGMRQAVFQTGAHHFALRQAGEFYYYVTNPSISEVTLIYGRTALTQSGHATVGTGISTVALCQSEAVGGPEHCSRGWGIPLVAEAALSWWVVGVGAQAFANVNQERSYMGWALFFQVGKLR